MQSFKNILLKGSENRDMLVDIFYKDNGVLKPIVIYVHGFNGFKDWGNFDLIAQQFAENGFVFIKMNLSHNGTTTDFPEEFADLNAYGNNNYTKELFDVEQIINWVIDEKNMYKSQLNINQISFIGHSRGGGREKIHKTNKKKHNTHQTLRLFRGLQGLSTTKFARAAAAMPVCVFMYAHARMHVSGRSCKWRARERA